MRNVIGRAKFLKSLGILILMSLTACSGGGGGGTATLTNPNDLFAGAALNLTVSINSGATYTTSTSVTLTLSANGNPTQMYITQTAGCSTGGTTQAYSSSVPWTLATPNATNTVYVQVTKGGNSSACVSASIIHDDIPPSSPSISINGGAGFTNNPSVSLTLSAGSSPTEMYITNTAGCSAGGAWAPYNTSNAWTLPSTNTSNTVYVKYRDAALNESSCVSASITHDDIAPTVAITSPLSGSYIYSANVNAFSMSGTCSENGQVVSISGSATGSATCSSGTWSTSLNLSSLAEGAQSFTVTHADAATNSATANVSVTKDTIAPSSPTISVNGGAAYTTSTAATLALSAVGATEMYITQTASCSSGGTWSAYATSSPWTLANANASNTIYVKYRDVALNESSCVSATIIHDNTAPTLTVTQPANGSYISAANVASYTLSGTCSENGGSVVISGSVSTTASCTNGSWTKSVDLSALVEGAASFTFNLTDAAGNSAAPITRNVTKDTIAPSSPTIAIDGGASTSLSTSVTLTLSAVGASQMYVTQTSTCASGGVWEAYATSKAWTLQNAETNNTVYVKYRDAALNMSACVNATILHDPLPTLAISSPANGSYINSLNQTSFTVSGTCSPSGRNVSLTGAITTSAACSSGAWSHTFDFSSVMDGPIIVNADYTNASGTPATQVSYTFTKSTAGPQNNAIEPSGTWSRTHTVYFTNQLNNTLTMTADGATQMYVTTDPLCSSGGAWEAFSTTKAWVLPSPNALNTIYAIYKDAAGNFSPCVSGSVLHDDLPPTMTITAPNDGDLVLASNQTAFALSGTCSDEGRTVIISGAMNSTAVCNTGGWWSRNLNVSTLPDGVYTLNFDIDDGRGNAAATQSRWFTKDAAGPTGGSIVINNGDLTTRSTSASLTLSAVGATDMYVTNNRDCNGYGVWESYSTSKSWTLLKKNAVTGVYVKYRKANGNMSDCIGSTIIEDEYPPYWVTPPTHAVAMNSLSQSPLVTYTENATDTLSGVDQYYYAIGTGKSGAALNDVKDWTPVSGGSFTVTGLSLTNKSTYYVNMKVFDKAGNERVLSSSGWVADISAPNISVTSPAQNEKVTEVDQTISGTCETGHTITLSYSSGISGPASATCVNNSYNVYIELTDAAGARSVDITATNTFGTSASTHLDFTYVKSYEIKGQILAMAKAADGSIFYGGDFLGYTDSSDYGSVRISSSGVKDLTFSLKSGFNGNVLTAVELPDGSIVFGGDFTKFRGRTANRIAKIDSSGNLDLTFSPQTGYNGLNAPVRALVVYGSSIYVAGDFTGWRAKTTFKIAKIDFDGNLDQNFNPPTGPNGTNAAIRTMLLSGSSLYLGGDFTQYRGMNAQHVAKVDLTTGDLDPSFSTSGANTSVYSLALNGGALYVGGSFTTYQGQSAKAIAKVDASSGAIDAAFSPAASNGFTSPSPIVYGLAAYGADVIAVGKFTAYRGAPANYVARIAADGTLDSSFSPGSGGNGFNNNASCVMVVGSDIYVGGLFSSYRGSVANHLAKLSGAGDLDSVFNPSSGSASAGVDGAVNALTLSQSGQLYVSGSFTAYRPAYLARNILKTDAIGNIDTSFNLQDGSNGFDGAVRALAIDGTTLYVGGDFLNFGSSPAPHIAKMDLSGNLDTVFNPSTGDNGTNGTVRAIAVNGTQVFIGGDFLRYRNQVANRIAKIDNSTGDLDTVFNPTPGYNGFNGSVYAIAATGSTVYVGGSFTYYKTDLVNRIVKLDANTGGFDSTFSSASPSVGADGAVLSIVLNGTDIYLGGTFLNYRGSTVNRLAKITTDGSLDATFSASNGGTNSTVYAMTVAGSSLVFTGLGTTYRGLPINRVGKVDLVTGNLDTTFSPATGANGLGGYQPQTLLLIPMGTALLYDGSKITIGGSFTQYRGHQFNYKVSVDLAGSIVP